MFSPIGNRSWLRRSRIVLLMAALLVAQFGVASHPLHADGGKDGQKVELACAFCIAGAHWQTVPHTTSLQFGGVVLESVDDKVSDVVEACFAITSRITRGPPRSTPCV